MALSTPPPTFPSRAASPARRATAPPTDDTAHPDLIPAAAPTARNTYPPGFACLPSPLRRGHVFHAFHACLPCLPCLAFHAHTMSPPSSSTIEGSIADRSKKSCCKKGHVTRPAVQVHCHRALTCCLSRRPVFSLLYPPVGQRLPRLRWPVSYQLASISPTFSRSQGSAGS